MNTAVILFLESLGGGELLVILLFVLLFFGSKNIPSLARGLGKGIREFKDAMNGVQSEIKQGMYEIERQTTVMPSGDEKAAPSVKQDTPPPAEPEALNEALAPTPEIRPEERSAAR